MSVRFEVVASRSVPFNGNNFAEVGLKHAVDESKPDDPGVRFVSISRGYVDTAGRRRFRAHFTCPPDPALIDFLVSALTQMRETASVAPGATA